MNKLLFRFTTVGKKDIFTKNASANEQFNDVSGTEISSL